MRSCAVFLLCALSVLARDARVTLLATTDLHGNLYPWDYFTAQPADRGLAKIATLIHAERRQNPNTILIDVGDTIQGTPLESAWQTYVRTGSLPLKLQFQRPAPKVDPMMAAMNQLGYAAMTVGNHEFNFGLKNLDQARSAAEFPWLSANTRASGELTPFQPFIVQEIAGVKVAIIGVTTPAIPNWEKPENYTGYMFTDAKSATAAAIDELRRKHHPDLIIAAVHAGLEQDLKTGQRRSGELSNENMVYQLATEVPGLDAIVFGHSHQVLAGARVSDVLLVQPKNWGMSLAVLDFELESKEGGGWHMKSKNSRLVPVTASVPADPAILRLAAPYHEATERFLQTPIAESKQPVDASKSRIQDTAIIDAVHTVQLHYAQADVSFASSFNPRAAIPKGPITVRQIASLYVYDNELYAIEGNGRMVREALENAARFYNTCASPDCGSGPLINRSVIGYNYDMAQGVDYELDLTKPAGQRVRNLTFKGQPLADDRKLRIAVNNYRAGGSGGYTMFRGAPVVWRSWEDLRELIIRYYSTHPFPSQPDENWRVVPEAARRVLESEIHQDSSRPLTQ